jgi:hypothetical protein
VPSLPPSLQVLDLLDALIDGMECGGDAAGQQLDLLRQPLLQELRAAKGQSGSGPGSSQGQGQEAAAVAVLCLLGTLCEKQPEAAAELRQEGALASVAQHLLQGGLLRLPPAVPPAVLRGLLECLLPRCQQFF